MHVLLYILSANLDSIGVGFSYTARKIHISRKALLIIAVFSAFCSGLSLFIGTLFGGFMPYGMGDFLSKAILIILGTWIMFSSLKPDDTENQERTFRAKELGITVSIIRNPALCDFDASSKIDGREVWYLALALSLDSIAIGLGLGLSGVLNWYLPFLIGISQYAFLELGQLLGSFFVNKFKISHRIWTVLAGLCLILLAIFG